MKKIFLFTIFFVFGLASTQTMQAQLLKKIKKKTEKKIENTVDGKNNSKKSTPKVNNENSSKDISSSKSTKTTIPKKTTSSSTGDAPPSWVDTSRARNAFWKEEIAQKLLNVTGVEPYKSSFAWNKAKSFTEGYNSIKETIAKAERPDVAADLVDFIDLLLDPEEFDTRLADFNEKMEGPFSSTNFWKETKKTILEWKKVALDWKQSPAVHFNREGIPFETSVDYLHSVTIDTISNEDYFDLKFDIVDGKEPKFLRFTTIMDLHKKEYEGDGFKISALDDGYYVVTIDKAYRVVFGPNAKGAKKIEDSLGPVFPESSMDDCVVCAEITGTTGSILMTTEGKPTKSKGIDFYKGDEPWDGISPIYARFVLPETPENIRSKTNPWTKKDIYLRWYVKGEKENIQMGWSPDDIANAKDPTFWYRMYDGVDKQILPPRTFEYLHYVLMRKGAGEYTVVGQLFMKERDDPTGRSEKILAVGEKPVNLSASAYKKLFVNPKVGIGAYRPPKYTGAANASIKAAVRKMYPNVKSTYMSENNEWKWVLHPITGVRMYQVNHGVVTIVDLNEEKRKGGFYIKLTAKKDGAVYSIVGEEEYIETSMQNFNIN
ncbi:hypothetical protein [Flagellimonas nanhaiensis]|nr:hypothetical protein [Allomuricauda nanhaiensis]